MADNKDHEGRVQKGEAIYRKRVDKYKKSHVTCLGEAQAKGLALMQALSKSCTGSLARKNFIADYLKAVYIAKRKPCRKEIAEITEPFREDIKRGSISYRKKYYTYRRPLNPKPGKKRVKKVKQPTPESIEIISDGENPHPVPVNPKPKAKQLVQTTIFKGGLVNSKGEAFIPGKGIVKVPQRFL